MSKKKRNILIMIAFIVLLPLWMWLAWLFTPKKKLVIAIIDKTALTTKGQEHASLTWILNHERFTKTSTQSYNVSKDYFGFFPLQQEHFRLKGLERFTASQLDQLSNDCKAVYFTDTYGVFSNEWFTGKNMTERSGVVYGGMSKEDLVLLQKMKEKHKLIITEFNAIGSPTAPEIRQEFEKMFGIQWSGWIGRYFESLDTTLNKELPHWLKDNYLKQNNNQWPFKHPGVAFVSNQEQVVILEEKTHLNESLPHIITHEKGQAIYGLPTRIKYSFWFDVMKADSSINEVIAHFNVDVNEAGKKQLARYGIPAVFPAVTEHVQMDYSFYYFSADFCDNHVSMTSSYFKGVGFFKPFFYDKSNPVERKSFFWNYYRPMMTSILRASRKEDQQ